jgi:hypothetical protein
MGATLVKSFAAIATLSSRFAVWSMTTRARRAAVLAVYKVLGSTQDVPRIVDELSIQQVVIALDEASGMEIRRILDVCSAIPVKAQIVPSLNEIAHGRVSVSRIRDVQIEDLLGRDPVKLDDENLHEFSPAGQSWLPVPADRLVPSWSGRSSTTGRSAFFSSSVRSSFFSRSDVSCRTSARRVRPAHRGHG